MRGIIESFVFKKSFYIIYKTYSYKIANNIIQYTFA